MSLAGSASCAATPATCHAFPHPPRACIGAQSRAAATDAAKPHGGKPPKDSEILRGMVASLVLVRGGDARTYARVGGELVPIDSVRFRQRLAVTFHGRTGRDADPRGIERAIFRLGGTDLRETITPLRFAEAADGTIWIDLGPGPGAFVRISAAGVDVTSACPLAFVRPDGMRRLPPPEIPADDAAARAALEDFWRFLQFDRPAAVAAFTWLVAAMRPAQDPETRAFRRFPILALVGSQARGKTSKADCLRGVVDPRTPAHADLPSSAKELAIVGENQRVLSFDNVSAIGPIIADALCRRATGDGLEVRALYSNRDVTVLAGSNPVLLNAIADAIFERPDLLSRTLILDVPRGDRVATDEEVIRRFDEVRGRVFGALCYCISRAVREAAGIPPPEGVRMSSAASWAIAAGRAVGITDAEVADAFRASARRGEAIVLDKALPSTLLAFIKPGKAWTGSAGQLLEALTAHYEATHGRSPPRGDWPWTAKALSEALARLEPALASAGIRFDWRQEGSRREGRNFTVRRVLEASAPDGDG